MAEAIFPSSKRSRQAEPCVADVLHYARLIMHNDPFKERAPKEENRAFRALFGCGANIVLLLWKGLEHFHLVPDKATMTHLLWTLMYLKTNARWSTMRKLTGGVDPKTLRKWIFEEILPAITLLEPMVVSLRVLLFAALSLVVLLPALLSCFGGCCIRLIGNGDCKRMP